MTKNMFLDPKHDRHDVALFIFTLAFGSLGIVALKLLSVHQGWVTAFPCVVLPVYFVYVWRTKRYQLRGDRAGDSVYYLGFLYTLVSLGISLFQFVFAGLDARTIVGNLGIALFTTILGLAGRVVLTQLREDPVEMEESARMALAEAASMVRAELSQMVEDVNTFRRTTMQSIREGSEEISRETNKTLSENVKSFTDSAQSVVQRIEEVFTEFGDNAKRLNQVSAGTIKALEKLIRRVEAIDAPHSLISDKFEPLADRINEVMGALNAQTAEQQQSVERLRTAVEGTIQAAASSLSNLDKVASNLGRMADDIGHQTSAIATSAETAKRLAENVSATFKHTTETQTETLSRHTQASEQAMLLLTGSIGTALDSLTSSQAEFADKFSAKVGEVGALFEATLAGLVREAVSVNEQSVRVSGDISKALRSHGDQVSAAIGDLLSRQEQFLQSFNESHVAALHASVAALTGWIEVAILKMGVHMRSGESLAPITPAPATQPAHGHAASDLVQA